MDWDEFLNAVTTCSVLIHENRWWMDVWRVVAISEVDFALALSSFPLAINSWQFLYGEFDNRTHRTADPTRLQSTAGY